jgi:hypothetical protein
MPVKKVRTVDADGFYQDEYVAVEETPKVQPGTTISRNNQLVATEPARHGVVGPLDRYAREDFDNREKTEAYIGQLAADGERFKKDFPQVPFSDDADGKANTLAVNTWLSDHGVGGTYLNLVKALNDVFQQLVFNPSAAGLTLYGTRLTGQALVNRMPQADYDRMFRPVPAPRPDYENQTAAEFKATHPEGWEYKKKAVMEHDVNFTARQVEDFTALRPEYIKTAENRQLLLDTIRENRAQVNVNSLLIAFDQLVKSGKMTTNSNVDLRVGNTRRVDFTGEGAGRERSLSDAQDKALRFVRTHSSKEIEERTQRDPAFRAALNSL